MRERRCPRRGHPCSENRRDKKDKSLMKAQPRLRRPRLGHCRRRASPPIRPPSTSPNRPDEAAGPQCFKKKAGNYVPRSQMSSRMRRILLTSHLVTCVADKWGQLPRTTRMATTTPRAQPPSCCSRSLSTPSRTARACRTAGRGSLATSASPT